MDGDQGVGVAELTPAAVERFVAERRRAGYRGSVSPKSLRPLLAYHGGLGVLAAGDGEPLTPLEKLLVEYRDYLLVERALTPGSVGVYEPVARLFLEERSAPIGADLARLSGREIHAFVLREARQRGQHSAETMVCALRSLLRFLHVQGWIASPLATAVPSVRKQRQGLPRGLAARQVRLLLESCDSERPVGRRGFAILMLLVRLGLRRGEVAALELDDVDWRAGEIMIRGKGARIDRLPLPTAVSYCTSIDPVFGFCLDVARVRDALAAVLIDVWPELDPQPSAGAAPGLQPAVADPVVDGAL